MLISFSEQPMLPYIRDGIRQANGEDVRGARVKRQTIRQRGARAADLLDWCRAHDTRTIPYDLHLWWKSRTPDRLFLGAVRNISIWPIEILHSCVIPPEGGEYPCIRIDGPHGWRDGDTTLFWSPGHAGGEGFAAEAYADGFDSPEAFRDYFVPNFGDRFDAVLFRW